MFLVCIDRVSLATCSVLMYSELFLNPVLWNLAHSYIICLLTRDDLKC